MPGGGGVVRGVVRGVAGWGLAVCKVRIFRHRWPDRSGLCRFFRVMAGGRFEFFDTDPTLAAWCVDIVQSQRLGVEKATPPERRLSDRKGSAQVPGQVAILNALKRLEAP